MLGAKIKLTYMDGRELVGDITPGVQVAWERHFAEPQNGFRPSIVDIGTNQKTEWIYYLAFLVARKANNGDNHPGPFVSDFEQWLDTLSDIDLIVDDVPLDETTS